MKTKNFFSALLIITGSVFSINAQTLVNSLAELQDAIQSSNQTIILTPGDYNIEDLPSNSRYFHCTGNNNTIDLTGVYIDFPVGSSEDQHFLITGNNNILQGGVFENTYSNGMTEVTDYISYNQDKRNLAYGADPHLVIQGDSNTVIGMKLTIRGSFPYGYGSLYGINNNNVFGLDKRGGIAVQGTNVTIDGCELQMRAFGHGIYIQSPSDHTVIKNTIVEGDVRSGADLYAETDPDSFPYRSGYNEYSTDFENPIPIDPDNVFSLCEDGIRVYTNGGSIEVENCTVKKMRGGIRTYLSSGATVTNSVAIDCGSTNFNLPANGTITGSSGNFSFSPLNDHRLGRSGQDIELTILPSPNAEGNHNLADVQGNNHNIVFHRTPGPIDSEEERAIVITGDNSTIVNETEYAIILESSANGNTIVSCGPVTDNGSNNKVSNSGNCEGIDVISNCDSHDALVQIEAEDFCNESGIQKSNNNTAVGFINDGDWISFENVDFSSGINSIEMNVSSANTGGTIEIRQGSTLGTIIGTVEVPVTGSYTTWETVKANISGVTEEHDIYLMFNGGSGFLFDVDWFKFSSSTLSIGDLTVNTPNQSLLYPNPVTSITSIVNAENSTISIYDMNGKTILTKSILSDKESIDLSKLSSGIYYAELNSRQKREVIKLIKN